MGEKNLYDVLGVDKSASERDIKRAYRKLARKKHPDVSKEDNAKEKFVEIQNAYDVLSDPEKRQEYDQFGTIDGKGPDGKPRGGGFPGGAFRSHGGGARGGRTTFTFRSGGGGSGGGGGGFDSMFDDLFSSMFADAGPFGGRPGGRGHHRPGPGPRGGGPGPGPGFGRGRRPGHHHQQQQQSRQRASNPYEHEGINHLSIADLRRIIDGQHEESHRPWIIHVYSYTCASCNRVQTLLNSFEEKIGGALRFGSVKVSIRDMSQLPFSNVDQLPLIISAHNGKYNRFQQDRVNGKTITQFIENSFDIDNQISIIKSEAEYDQFLRKANNKVSVILLSTKSQPSLLEYLAALRYSDFIQFGHVIVSSSPSSQWILERKLVKNFQSIPALVFSVEHTTSYTQLTMVQSQKKLVVSSLRHKLDKERLLSSIDKYGIGRYSEISNIGMLYDLCSSSRSGQPTKKSKPSYSCIIFAGSESSTTKQHAQDSFDQFIKSVANTRMGIISSSSAGPFLKFFGITNNEKGFVALDLKNRRFATLNPTSKEMLTFKKWIAKLDNDWLGMSDEFKTDIPLPAKKTRSGFKSWFGF